MKMICASASLRMPSTLRRVVCGLGVTIATLCPTIRLTSVDLPTLERPPSTMKPARCSISAFTKLHFDLCERGARRRLLALFLAAAFAGAQFLACDADASGKALGVIGPARRHQFINRLRAISPIRDLLQLGLVVALGRGTTDVIDEQ